MKLIRMYWWNESPNFGDALNPLLVQAITGHPVVWSPLETADIVGAGSLLQWVAKIEDKLVAPLHVWGSGYIFDQEPAIKSALVKHHAVRGHKTLAYGKLTGVALGDAGLLANALLDKPITKKYRIGIVPHLWHLNDPVLLSLLKQDSNLKLIDVRLHPLDVIRQIGECEFVYASSLHGLIVADSLNVPNQWIHFDVSLFGGDWKFNDYYSVFEQTPNPIQLIHDSSLATIAETVGSNYYRPGIDVIQKQLLATFPSELM